MGALTNHSPFHKAKPGHSMVAAVFQFIVLLECVDKMLHGIVICRLEGGSHLMPRKLTFFIIVLANRLFISLDFLRMRVWLCKSF